MESKPQYNFYFRCKACGSVLNNTSFNVRIGIEESPYCSKCSAVAFDTSDGDRQYEHGYLTDNYFLDLEE